MTILETERLLLREFTLEDVEAVYEFGSNEEVTKYTGDPLVPSREEAENIIRNVWFEDYKIYGYGRLATIYKPDNKLIGFAGLKYLPEFEETDLGFRFLPQYWGQGLATEASRALLDFGFKHLMLKRIIGIAMPENIGSWKVLEKVGMEFYKTDDYDGDGGSYRWYKIER